MSSEKTISGKPKLSKISIMTRCNLGPTPKLEFKDVPIDVLHEASKITLNFVVVTES